MVIAPKLKGHGRPEGRHREKLCGDAHANFRITIGKDMVSPPLSENEARAE